MNKVSTTRVIFALIVDTFRQSMATKMFWVMFGLSIICTLLCFSISVTGARTLVGEDGVTDFVTGAEASGKQVGSRVDGSDVIGGNITFAFGLIGVPLGRDAKDAVNYLMLMLAGPIADTAGILLALIWTAGFLPGFLEPSAISVLLAKPVSRGSLLIGKYLGVLLFVLVQSTFFVVGTWFALGSRTGVWIHEYLWCIPILLIHFAIFYCFSLFLAVASRSTVVCVLGSILFWFICWGMNTGRHTALAETLTSEQTSAPILPATEVAKPASLAKTVSLQNHMPDPKSSAQKDVASKQSESQKTDARKSSKELENFPTDHGMEGAEDAKNKGAAAAPKTPGETMPKKKLQPRMQTARFSFAVEVGYWILPKPLDMADLLFAKLGAEKYFAPISSARIVREHGKLSPTMSVLSSLIFTVLVLWGATYEFKVVDY